MSWGWPQEFVVSGSAMQDIAIDCVKCSWETYWQDYEASWPTLGWLLDQAGKHWMEKHADTVASDGGVSGRGEGTPESVPELP